MTLLDGEKVASEMLLDITTEVGELQIAGVQPKLAVILVGQDPASLSYVRKKQKACSFTGIEWIQHDFDVSVTTEELLLTIEKLNEDESVHGILVQLPLPKQVYVPAVIKAIDPRKDVDGFVAYNLGKMFLSTEFEHLVPCTPKGVIKLLDYYGIELAGKEVVVVGHSNIVGKPLAAMMMNRDATVTVCHSVTKDLSTHTRRADIVCVAVGKPNLITAEMVKDGVVVIDIGTNWLENGKIVGDVDFTEVAKKASFISPVPRGVGPMTVACLMENTLFAAKRMHDESIVKTDVTAKIY